MGTEFSEVRLVVSEKFDPEPLTIFSVTTRVSLSPVVVWVVTTFHPEGQPETVSPPSATNNTSNLSPIERLLDNLIEWLVVSVVCPPVVVSASATCGKAKVSL